MPLGQDLDGLARWAVPLAVFAVVVAVGITVRAVAFRMLGRWSATTTTRVDDLVIAATRGPSVIWILILAVLAAFQVVDLPGEAADTAVHRILTALLILSITIGLARLLGDLQAAVGDLPQRLDSVRQLDQGVHLRLGESGDDLSSPRLQPRRRLGCEIDRLLGVD